MIDWCVISWTYLYLVSERICKAYYAIYVTDTVSHLLMLTPKLCKTMKLLCSLEPEILV